jgi:thiol-disulfide isomerase/thioredoxin
VTLADFHGKVVLLTVWATWCHPCEAEVRQLARLQSTLGGDSFAVVALSIDQGGLAHVQSFYEQAGVSQLGLYVDSAGYIVRDLNIVGIPTALLIGRDGREVARAVGPIDWDSAEVITTIERVLYPAP